MNLSKIALVCHLETDATFALEVLQEHGSEIAAGIDLQITRGRDPHVVFTHDSEEGSLLLYAGNREFAIRNGFPVAEDVAYLALAFPAKCEQAVEIKAKLVRAWNTLNLSPPHA